MPKVSNFDRVRPTIWLMTAISWYDDDQDDDNDDDADVSVSGKTIMLFDVLVYVVLLCVLSEFISQTIFVVPVTLGWIFAGLVVFIILTNIIVAIIVHRCSRLDIHGYMKRLASINMTVIGNALRLRCFGAIFIYLIIHWTRNTKNYTVYKPKYAEYNYTSLLFSVIKETYNYTMINLLRVDPKGPKGMGAFCTIIYIYAFTTTMSTGYLVQ